MLKFRTNACLEGVRTMNIHYFNLFLPMRFADSQEKSVILHSLPYKNEWFTMLQGKTNIWTSTLIQGRKGFEYVPYIHTSGIELSEPFKYTFRRTFYKPSGIR
jgi:hypothetical protein